LEVRNICHILVGKPEGERSFGRPSCRWENSIKMNLKEIGREDVNWIALTEDVVQWWTLVSTVFHV
jgi:hypothetical protein